MRRELDDEAEARDVEHIDASFGAIYEDAYPEVIPSKDGFD